MDSSVVRIIVIALATIGAFVMLSAVSMLFMHTSMMGGAAGNGMWASMVSLCRGMMGG